jgi:membrane-bound lytic murein transglycosylase D
MRALIYSLFIVIAWLPGGAYADAPEANGFVRPAELEHDIAFWRRVYTEVTTRGGLIHDPWRLDVVYEVIELPADLTPKQRSKLIDEVKRKYARILERIARGADDLSPEEQRVKDLWPKHTRRERFEQAAEEVRFQLGQADRFREGLIRSGAWRDYIAATFERMGLPRELAVLPHVESSFNPYAYSKVGAAGMWQFMRSTGRRFLRIDAAVDERLDPYRSTEAAARFLEQNYIVLGSWPLALTAYNHGPGGMRRAQEQMGTSDITTIVRRYSSRTFGFASRNFYVAFLAALEIDANPEKFFGPIELDKPDTSIPIEMPAYLPAAQVVAALEVDRDELKRLNPALLPSVWSGVRHIPRGYALRVPNHVDVQAALAKLSALPRADAQLADSQHRVRPGETLSTIAKQYGTSTAVLAQLNDLRQPYLIRAGQVLTLPVKPATPAVLAKASSAPAKPTPPTGVVDTGNSYVVRRGDTLSKIAARHGMSEDVLMELNDIRNRNFIYEGQVLALVDSARVAPPVESEVSVDNTAVPTSAAVLAAEAAEPDSAREAQEIGPALVPGIPAAASADPSDYSVRSDGTIIVQAAETLGHYAEWLGLRSSQLRSLNRMSSATPVVVGRTVKLDFSKVSRDDFEAKRQEYHRQLQEAFFARFRIKGNSTHVVRRGESIWVLAQQRYNIPIWLLRQYNPDVDLGSVRPGTTLIIPVVEAIAAERCGTDCLRGGTRLRRAPARSR